MHPPSTAALIVRIRRGGRSSRGVGEARQPARYGQTSTCVRSPPTVVLFRTLYHLATSREAFANLPSQTARRGLTPGPGWRAATVVVWENSAASTTSPPVACTANFLRARIHKPAFARYLPISAIACLWATHGRASTARKRASIESGAYHGTTHAFFHGATHIGQCRERVNIGPAIAHITRAAALPRTAGAAT